MSNINKITVNGTTYDIEDTTARASSGLTADIKSALLACFEQVAWISDDGQEYYDDLYEALYPPANLTSISCVYTQSGTVYDTDSLDSLKTDLVVTAHWDDTTTSTVASSQYTLSGTLTTGTSTITVTYGGKTTTFNVTVTHATQLYSITNNLTNATNSNNASQINELTAYTATLSAETGYILTTVSVTMGNTDVTSTVYDSSDGSISIASVTGNIVITAEAVEDVGWISGVAYQPTWTSGYNIDSSTGLLSEHGSYSATDFLPCHGVTAIAIERSGTNAVSRAYYDENQTYISGSGTFYADVGDSHLLVPTNAYYVRIGTQTSGLSTYSATPYLYPTLTDTTVWQSGQIYNLSVDGNLTDYAFCFGASTIEMLVDASIYGYRGSYSLYDSAKQQTNSMANTNNFTRTDITVPSDVYYFRVYTVTSGFLMLARLT